MSLEFVLEGSDLRRDLGAISDDGSATSARLRAAIGALLATPLDDNVAEGATPGRRQCRHMPGHANSPGCRHL